ncbi:hypothetical protein KGM_211706 [Danaus plexippus plexippus]|uniref:Uncharacterized protein n=1 Tax=Danaus plexippus plexippus TaxID=278856 RepID=A0A212FFV7_DANPL|nr:hypothetical protein KGM_211706 [Danaus plexippus plexippus]
MDEDDVQQFSLRWHNHQVDTLRTVLSEATLFLILHWTPYKWY